MAQPKYAARFENFFLNLRLNRDQFADMAAFTLQALETQRPALAGPLGTALAAYRATHTGQLSGAGQAATITLAQALTDFQAYVKRVERKFILPNYEDGSADVKALLPNGRSGLSKSNQTEVEDAFVAFLDALDDRPTVFPPALRQEGRATVLPALQQALARADGRDTTAGTQRLDLHDGRQATCLALFRAYASLLVEFAENPKKAAPFFDFSNAEMGGGKKAKLPTGL